MRKILLEQRIIARDQNKVFVVLANSSKQSPADVENTYNLDEGKGNTYIEFDVEKNELDEQKNKRLGIDEYFLRGDVDLTDRSPVAIFNIGGSKQWKPVR